MEQNVRKTRQNLLVNPPFQWAMIRWTAFISLLSSGIYYLSNLVFFQHLLDLGQAQNLPANSPYFQFVSHEASKMNLIFAMTTFITLAIILMYGIRFSHRVAGPLYRFSKYLKEQDPSKGEPLPDLKFREHDFFTNLSDDFNRFKAKIPSQGQG